MSFAQELNQTATDAVFNIQRTIYKETQQYYENVLRPALSKQAELGYYFYKLNYYFVKHGKTANEHDIVNLGKSHGSYGYDLQNIFGYLRSDGFNVIQQAGDACLRISWGDEVLKEI